MIQRALLGSVLALLVIGCKAKRSYAEVNQAKSGPVETTVKPFVRTYKGDGIHPLEEDTGTFEKIEISSIQEYIDMFADIARAEMKAYGIPASITLAQGLLESGFGKGALTMRTNNHFGIKCHFGWQGDYDYHDDDEVGECFRKYNHPRYSFRDHSIFLSSRSRYSFLFDLRSDDYKKWAKGLQQAGYATDKKYPQKLIQLIEKYELHAYDDVILDEGYRKAVVKNIGNTKTHTVQKGDTLWGISKKYSMTLEELKRLNELNGSVLSIGQELVVKSAEANK